MCCYDTCSHCCCLPGGRRGSSLTTDGKGHKKSVLFCDCQQWRGANVALLKNKTWLSKKKAKRFIKRRCFKKRSQDRSRLCLQFFRSVQSTCTELLKVIEKYQHRITRESDSESASQWGRNSRRCYIRALRRHTTNHYGWTFCWCVQLSRI